MRWPFDSCRIPTLHIPVVLPTCLSPHRHGFCTIASGPKTLLKGSTKGKWYLAATTNSFQVISLPTRTFYHYDSLNWLLFVFPGHWDWNFAVSEYDLSCLINEAYWPWHPFVHPVPLYSHCAGSPAALCHWDNSIAWNVAWGVSLRSIMAFNVLFRSTVTGVLGCKKHWVCQVWGIGRMYLQFLEYTSSVSTQLHML